MGNISFYFNKFNVKNIIKNRHDVTLFSCLRYTYTKTSTKIMLIKLVFKTTLIVRAVRSNLHWAEANANVAQFSDGFLKIFNAYLYGVTKSVADPGFS